MAIITAPLLTALNTGFKTEFQKALNESTPSDYLAVASIVPSTTKSNTYGWLGQMPGFRKWIGERQIKSLKAHGYVIENESFESTVGVLRNDIEDDNIGVYAPLMAELGRAAKAHPDELTFSLLKEAFETLCFDGQNFFDTDHPVYPNADGTGEATTVSNMTEGTNKPWFLIDASRAIKPIIYQERKKPTFIAMTKPDDEAVFTSGEFRYGVDNRSNVGFSLWQLAHASKATLDTANFNAAYDAMLKVKADGGRPLGVKPTVLVVGPANRAAADALINAREIEGTSNTLYNKVKVVETPWID